MITFRSIFLFYYFTQQEKQSKRGGLTLCLNDKEVADEFRSIVKDGPCSKRLGSPAGSCLLKKSRKLLPERRLTDETAQRPTFP